MVQAIIYEVKVKTIDSQVFHLFQPGWLASIFHSLSHFSQGMPKSLTVKAFRSIFEILGGGTQRRTTSHTADLNRSDY